MDQAYALYCPVMTDGGLGMNKILVRVIDGGIVRLDETGRLMAIATGGFKRAAEPLLPVPDVYSLGKATRIPRQNTRKWVMGRDTECVSTAAIPVLNGAVRTVPFRPMGQHDSFACLPHDPVEQSL